MAFESGKSLNQKKSTHHIYYVYYVQASLNVFQFSYVFEKLIILYNFYVVFHNFYTVYIYDEKKM